MTSRIRFDVWTGDGDIDHVARAHFELGDTRWAERASRELADGYLVNLRAVEPGEGWGPDQTFDTRIGGTA